MHPIRLLLASFSLLGCLFLAASPASAQAPCAADISGNGVVDALDLGQVLNAWGACQGCSADIDVQGFLTATGFRLPTEAEWEYAYRAGTPTAFHSMPGYPNGTNDDTQVGAIAWYSSNSVSQTRPVGGLAPNGFGLYDMSGNVWEWCNDYYGYSYYQSSPSTDPPGPASSQFGRVIRGGCWSDGDSETLRSSDRNAVPPNDKSSSIGFRVARTAS